MTAKGDLPMVTSDLASGEFRILGPEEYDLGQSLKKHGGVLMITEKNTHGSFPAAASVS